MSPRGALATVREAQTQFTAPATIIFCCFSPDDLAIYRDLMSPSDA